MKTFVVLRSTAILAGSAVALWVSIGVTLSFTIGKQSPATAAAWWPAGVTATVAQGQRELTAVRAMPASAIDAWRAKLRDAALREPVNSEALSTLGALDEYRGERHRAAMLFSAAETISRRNTFAELWLMEDAVRRGSVAKAIQHYNRAMLVSNDVRQTLLPILVDASAEPNVRGRLMPVLARRPLWWRDYMLQLGTTGESAAAMAAALRATNINIRNLDDAALAQLLLRRMVAIGAGQTAIVAANRLENITAPTRSLHDGDFEAPANLLPFAWWLRDETSIRAYRDTIPGGSTGLRVSTSSGTGGGVAQQMIGLAPGRYVLTGQAGNVSADRTARPTINLTCVSGTPLAQGELPPSDDAGRGFRFAFVIPATGCPLQWVAIVTAPAVDTDIWLDNLAIAR